MKLLRWLEALRARMPRRVLALLPLLASAHAQSPLLVQPAGPAEAPPAPWQVVGLPQQTKPFTRFSVATLEGQRALRVQADLSYGNLVHSLPEDKGKYKLSWRWRVEKALPGADLKKKEGDDVPIKVCAFFDLAESSVPFVERQLLRVARSRSNDPLPSATVCYVWDSTLPPGTALDNAFTRRIRFIVLRGPEAPLRTWMTEQRDVRADFLRAFADETTTVPPLIGIGIGADSDNTRGQSVAHVASITLD